MKKSEAILREKRLSVTKSRVDLLEFFIKKNQPLSILDFKKTKLFKEMNESSFYRNVIKFEEAGIIRSVPTANEYQSYELVQDDLHHHHHIICSACKSVKCLTECGLDKSFSKMASKVGYKLTGHSLELYGICPDCA
ncbi:Fur family transcriptional regulator [Bacteriovorax sp. DB6_IX]|uniref:Fur family transcriptional regulator n=1 Tax=Bacteriovorax sp. DB6_IX TaxID=1353530 RepID=UPI00054D8507|nr:transcriptional repressor [Bacteriovorax sp. DB6_IX]